MKKIISLLLVLVLAVGLVTACADEEVVNDGLTKAGDYLNALYKDESTNTTVDYDVVANVVYDGTTYPVTWTVDVTEGVTIVDSVNPGFKTIKVVRGNADIAYKLSGSITDGTTTITKTFDRVVPAKVSQAAIVDAAYALEAGAVMDGVQTLTGTISKIDTAYSESYKNITVTIIVENLVEKPIMCYRLKGDNAADLKVGDTITVEGTIKNYNGTIEFDAGCVIKAYTPWAPTEAEKVAVEQAALAVPTEILANKTLDLAATGATYTDVVVTWTADGVAVSGNYAVALGENERQISLVATLTLGQTTLTKTFTLNVAKQPTVVPQLVTAAPTAGTGYYIGVDYNGSKNFLTGAIGNAEYRLAFTEAVSGAAAFELEATTGGFYLKTTVGGATKYLNIVVNGTYVNNLYQDAPENVWVWNDTYKTLTVNVPEKGEYAITNTGFANVEAKAVTATGTKAQFFTLVDASSITDDVKIATEKDALNVETAINAAGTINLPVAGTTYTDVTVAWAVATNNYVTLNGNVLKVVLPTDANATVVLTATITCGTGTPVTKEFTLTVAVPPAQPDTIAEILAAKNTTTVFWAEGVVVATNSRSFLLKDATGYILVYENKAPTVAVGDKVDVKGKTSEHKGTWQFTDTGLTVTKIGTESSFAQPTPTVMDGAAFGAVAAPVAPAYVKVTGVLVKSGKYFNLNVDGSATPGSLTYLTGDLATAANALNGKLVEVVGYTTGNIGNFINLMVTSVAEATTTDAQKVEIEKNALSITTSFSSNNTLTLPATGTAYTGVTITWTVNGTAATGTYAITQTAEVQTLTVIATLTCGTATPVTKEFTVTVTAAPAPGTTPTEFVLSATNGTTTVYWTGAVSSFKLVATTDKSQAATVYTEDAGNGNVYIYVMDGTAKKYLKMTGDDTKKFALDTTASYKWKVTETSIQSAETSVSSRCIFSYDNKDFRTYAADYSKSAVAKAKLEAKA